MHNHLVATSCCFVILPVLRIRIRIRIPDPHNFGKLDPDLHLDPHHSVNLDPDPHQSEKQDPHRSEEVDPLEPRRSFWSLEGPNLKKSEW